MHWIVLRRHRLLRAASAGMSFQAQIIAAVSVSHLFEALLSLGCCLGNHMCDTLQDQLVSLVHECANPELQAGGAQVCIYPRSEAEMLPST